MKFLISATCCTLALLSPYAMAMDPDIRHSISNNIQTISPTTPESCEIPSAYSPSLELSPRNSDGRLITPLRQAAAMANPMLSLHLSALNFAQGKTLLGNAFADLSVTGIKSYASFKTLHRSGELTEAVLLDKLRRDLRANYFTEEILVEASSKALERAYKVANVLPYGNSSERAGLGYIAVSGEDDQPYYPVNIPTTEYTQYRMSVRVGEITVRTRYLVAESAKAPRPAPLYTGRILPESKLPVLSSNAKVLVYVHGMDSSMEEAMDLFHSLKKRSEQTGENWTMISMDLPTSAYADKLNHLSVSALSELGNPRGFPPGFDARGRHNVPVLNFMENFVVSFINSLDQVMPFKGQIQAVIGGSLGGNLTFRLGRRFDLPWLKNIVTWSPASIWGGLADGGDIFKQIGVATAWRRAGGDVKNLTETSEHRRDFFKDAFGGSINFGAVNIVPAQPDQWWHKDWPCFDKSRELSKVARYEIYNSNFRLWHWRLGAEQLIFSHQTPPDSDRPRYLDNHVNMLLACGEKDDFNFTNICSSTLKTAQKMTRTPGRAYIIENTGHSIHNERPNLFARLIEEFLH